MAVTAKLYGQYPLHLAKGLINFPSDTIKAALCTSSYTFNQDTHDFFDDITHEVTGTGYTAGGATLANVAVTYDADTNKTKIDFDDVTLSNSTITARYAIIYKSTGTASDSPLIAYVDFGEDIISTAGDFKLTVNAGGLITATVD